MRHRGAQNNCLAFAPVINVEEKEPKGTESGFVLRIRVKESRGLHLDRESLMGFMGMSPISLSLDKPSCTRRDHLLELVVDLLRGHMIEVVADGLESNPDQDFQQLVLLVPCIKESLDQFARNTSALRH